MLRILRWEKWQAAAIKRVRSTRRARDPKSENDPYSMTKVSVTSSWDDRAVTFCSAFPDGKADAYLIRILQYAALHDGLCGTISVPRSKFGPIVLTRVWDTVSSLKGKKVYDALLTHRLCEEVESFNPSGAALCVTRCVTCGGTQCGASCARSPSPSPSPSSLYLDRDSTDGDISEPKPGDIDLPGIDAGTPPSLHPGQPLAIKARVMVGGILDQLCVTRRGETLGQAQAARRSYAAGNLSDADHSRLLDRWLDEYPKAAAKAWEDHEKGGKPAPKRWGTSINDIESMKRPDAKES